LSRTVMTKEATRNKILEHAAALISQQGFNNTGIQEILESAGVAKGSFYFYFKSKEDLGLALIDYYAGATRLFAEAHLRGGQGSALQRLQSFFRDRRLLFEQEGWKGGCPIGNLTQEMGNLSEPFRNKLRGVLNLMQRAIRECLEEARARKEFDSKLDPDELAHFILDSWEGALLRMKAEGTTEPLIRFEKLVFDVLLGR
jgi:TetR/AcrR family transcriptional regulator, transcriptional repressor for nem operon